MANDEMTEDEIIEVCASIAVNNLHVLGVLMRESEDKDDCLLLL